MLTFSVLPIRDCLNKSVFSGIRVSWPVDETREPIGDVLSC